MRVELPSGGWVDVRENLKGKDKIAVHSVVKLKIKSGQEQEQDTTAAVSDLMHYALLANVITAWWLDAPIPADGGGVDAVEDLDIDDLNALTDATEHLLKKVNRRSPN